GSPLPVACCLLPVVSDPSAIVSRMGAFFRRTPPWPRWTRTIGLVLAAFAGGAVTNHLAHATTQAASPYAPFDQMARVLVLIENEYVEPAQRAKLIDGAIKGMVAELDPHSGYMAPNEFSMFQSETEGHFGGIGVEVDYKNDIVTVITPIEGSPAARAGIRP